MVSLTNHLGNMKRAESSGILTTLELASLDDLQVLGEIHCFIGKIEFGGVVYLLLVIIVLSS